MGVSKRRLDGSRPQSDRTRQRLKIMYVWLERGRKMENSSFVLFRRASESFSHSDIAALKAPFILVRTNQLMRIVTHASVEWSVAAVLCVFVLPQAHPKCFERVSTIAKCLCVFERYSCQSNDMRATWKHPTSLVRMSAGRGLAGGHLKCFCRYVWVWEMKKS